MRRRLAIAICFALAAGAARALLPEVKTRVQIIAYLAVVALFELIVRPRLGQRPNLVSLLLNAVAVTIAVVAVKIAIDGPLHTPRWVRDAAAVTGIAR